LHPFRYGGTIEKAYIGEGGIPALLFYHEGPQKPTILCQHGLTGSKEQMLATCIKLADSGFLAVAMDARNHGERGDPEFWQKLRGNLPMFLFSTMQQTAHDVTTVIDYLEERPEAEPESVGMMGVSMGGFITILSTTLDRRIKAAVSVVAGAYYGALMRQQLQPKGLGDLLGLTRKPLENLEDSAINFIEKYDPINHVDRFKPVPLLLLNGGKDDLVPLECATSLHDALQPVYKDAPGKLRLEVYPELGHDYTPEMESEAIKWFKDNLCMV